MHKQTTRDRLRRKVDDKSNIKRSKVLKIKLSAAEETIKLEQIKQLYANIIESPDGNKSVEARAVMHSYPPWNLYTDKLVPGSIMRVIGCDELYSPDGKKLLGTGLRCITLKDNNTIDEDYRLDMHNIERVVGWTALQQLRIFQFIYPDAYLRALGFIFLLDNAEEVLLESANGGEVNLDKLWK